MPEIGWDTLSERKLAGRVTEVMRFTPRQGLPYIKAVLAEKRDHIDVMFFGNNDFPIDRVRETLEAAKASRKPVVVVADLKLDDGTADISAFGKQAWDIDEFLAELQIGRATCRERVFQYV